MERPRFSSSFISFDEHTTSPEIAEIMSRLSPDDLPKIELIDEEKTAWQFFKDCTQYQTVVTVLFAEEWARRMQYCIEAGYPLDTCWRECAIYSGNDLITPPMAHRAARLLARPWKHGAIFLPLYEQSQKSKDPDECQAQIRILEDHLY